MRYENYTEIWKLHYENLNILRNTPKITAKSVTQFERSNCQAREKKINVTSLQTTIEIDNYIVFTVKNYISWT